MFDASSKDKGIPSSESDFEDLAAVPLVVPSRSLSSAWPEVLTLAEAAAYLRVPDAELARMVGSQGLPGRLIGLESRFSAL